MGKFSENWNWLGSWFSWWCYNIEYREIDHCVCKLDIWQQREKVPLFTTYAKNCSFPHNKEAGWS